MQTVTNGGETLTYTYDDRGYIRKVEKDANNYSEYRYNALGELIRENYKWSGTSYTMIYAYDVGGNITSKTQYAFVAGDGQVGTPVDTIPYTYDATWQDKLASYDGTNITYDTIGNPLDDGTWEYTWTQGRRLQQITDGTMTANYTYNSGGIRTGKTVNGTTTIFNIVGGNITWQKTGANTPVYFLYDSGSKLWGLKYNGSTYFYVRNAQNDVIKIVNSSGTVVVEYAYDAWGNPMGVTGSMAFTLGIANPFRYRGYYYDVKTGLYYLNARYYNPEQVRFINADTFKGLAGKLLNHNLFIYCLNQPTGCSDPSSHITIADLSFFKNLVEGYCGLNKAAVPGSVSNAIVQANTLANVLNIYNMYISNSRDVVLCGVLVQDYIDENEYRDQIWDFVHILRSMNLSEDELLAQMLNISNSHAHMLGLQMNK